MSPGSKGLDSFDPPEEFRKMQVSKDNGRTWTRAELLSPRYVGPICGVNPKRGLLCFLVVSGQRAVRRLWARRQRLQLDSLYIPAGGHGTGGRGWWDRYHETQPELFALQPDDTRSGWPGHSQKVCKSNPAVWDVWLAEVEALLEEDPNRTVFNAAASDAAAAGRCICEDCRAWDRHAGTPAGWRLRAPGWTIRGSWWIPITACRSYAARKATHGKKPPTACGCSSSDCPRI